MPVTDFHALVKDPFGPYPDQYILNDVWVPDASRRPILTNVMLTSGPFGNDIIGLDAIEHLYPLQNPSEDVFFFGVLKVASLSWLSKRGLEWLEQDLRQRDIEMHMQDKINPSSGLTLKQLYGNNSQEGMHIKVMIRCEKRAEALYMTTTSNPTDMLFLANPYPGLDAKQIARMFIIKSFEAITCSLSRNFMQRWRLLHAMEFIVDSDPAKTPIEKRGISYFVSGYLSRIHGNQRELYHRYIFDEDHDSDVDENGRTSTRRYLRHVSPNDIRGIFAAHADWILAQQLQRMAGKRIVNIRKWHRFCGDVKKLRRQARRADPRSTWGLPYGKTDDRHFTDGVDLWRFNVPQKELNSLKKCLDRTAKQPPRKKKRVASPTVDDIYAEDRPIEHDYDSDFSVPSSDPASTDSEDGWPDSDPRLVRAIPSFCWEVPELPPGSFVWRCPARHCLYRIDLLELTNENLRNMPRDDVMMFAAKDWESKQDIRVQAAFLRMANAHYSHHLKELDIKLVQACENRWTVEWDHPRWHEQIQPKIPESAPQPTVKEEEQEISRIPHPQRVRPPSERLANHGIPRYTFTRRPARIHGSQR